MKPVTLSNIFSKLLDNNKTKSDDSNDDFLFGNDQENDTTNKEIISPNSKWGAF